MNSFDEEDSGSDWDASTPVKHRSSPKKGRRAVTSDAAAAQSMSTKGLDDDVMGALDNDLDSPVKSQEGGVVAPPKPPRRRTGGWADASAKSAKGKRNSYGGYDVEEQGSTNIGSDKDMTAIPDLDDFQEEDFAAQVAKAPTVAVNQLVTYKELDKDLLRHSAFSALDDIDLKVLTRFLSPESEIKEDDVPWTWDTLLADVSSKLTVDSDLSQES